MSFTIQSTILLGIVLVVLTYALYFVFSKLKIKVTKSLFAGVASWILLAAFVRVFEDAKIYPTSFFTVTPGILILFTAIFIPVLFIGAWIEKKKKFPLWKTLLLTSAIAILMHLPFSKAVNVIGALGVLAVFGIVLLCMYAAKKFVKIDFFSFWALATHMFDASATFVSMQFFNYSEQHVLPSFLINIFGPLAMLPLKIIFLIPIIFAINKYSEDEYLRKFLLLAIFAIGLAPALRDVLRLLMAV